MRKPSLRVLALALCLAALPAFARGPNVPAKPLETVMSLQVKGEVDIDAAGSVVAFRFDAPPPESVRAAVESTIRGWRFVPIAEGEAVQAQTISMRMALVASDTGGTYRARIENVSLSAPGASGTAVRDTVTLQVKSLRPPRYPAGLYEISCKVLVGLRVGLDGKIEDAFVVQSALMDAQDQSEGARRALKYFEDATLDTARRWRFEVVRGQGVPTPADMTVFVPVNYSPQGREVHGKWRSIVRTVRTPAPWLPQADDRSRLGVADVGDSGAVPDAAKVRLATEQAGKLL